MIVKAAPQEKKTIYGIWKQIFSGDDGGWTDYYFKHGYESENTLLYKDAGTIAATLQRNPHTIMLNGRLLKTSMILGVATLPNYRRQGMMHALMESALDEAEHQELVTLIQAYSPSTYTQFGFKMVYYRRRYKIERPQVPHYSHEGLSYDVKPREMLPVYTAFVKRFDGFYIRDLKAFENLTLEVAAEGGRIVGCYAEGDLQAYATIYPAAQGIEIRECIYLNSAALMKIVNLALDKNNEVELHTSNAEDLTKLLPQCTYQEYGFTMARINDFELFNRLYNSKAKTVKEAFDLCEKPLYMHEYA